MSYLALITARGGSKRLPGKNIKPLGGKPLIHWSISTAKSLPQVSYVLVSTDDEQIAQVAREGGAEVPWLRPAELATDLTSSVDVALHALDWYEATHGRVDGLLLLQPTSPFRSLDSMRRGMAAFEAHEGRAVVGVSPAQAHPYWCYRVDGDRMAPFIERRGVHLRSQDLPPAYVLNGAFYLIKPAQLRDERSFYPADAYPLVMMSPQEAVDIDTEWDWRVAETISQEVDARETDC